MVHTYVYVIYQQKIEKRILYVLSISYMNIERTLHQIIYKTYHLLKILNFDIMEQPINGVPCLICLDNVDEETQTVSCCFCNMQLGHTFCVSELVLNTYTCPICLSTPEDREYVKNRDS